MKLRKLSVIYFVTSALILSSCVNNDYDLSDIDTTVKVQVNDLVVPLNLDQITLDKVISLGDDSQIKEVVDPVSGQKAYAAMESGTFVSSEINVPDFIIHEPTINKISASINMQELIKDETGKDPYEILEDFKNYLKTMGLYDESKEDEYKQSVWEQVKSLFSNQNKPLCSYDFGSKSTHFQTGKASVDKAIRSMDELGINAFISVCVTVPELNGVINVPIKDFKLKLPAGLDLVTNMGLYDKGTGILDLSEGDVVLENGTIALKCTIRSVIPSKSGIILDVKDNENGEVSFAGDLEVLSGKIEIGCDDFCGSNTFFDLPMTISYECAPSISDIAVNYFTGKIKYDIKDLNINPISLNNLPDMLSGQETDVVLSNPQIYIKVNNPLEKYHVSAQTGFSLCGERDGVKRETHCLDEGVITMNDAQNTFCLSPVKPQAYYSGYNDAEYARFSGLKKILSGKGLPDVINVNVVNPCVPEQKVVDFKLGEVVDKVQGDYTFYAPLALDEGSVIMYEKEDKDWNNETIEKLVVQKLHVSAIASSEIPLGATLTLTPLDKNGNAISGVTFTSSKLEPNAADQSIEFQQTGGEIKNLGGIHLRATIISGDADKIMQPVQKIEIKKLRAKVSGYYQDEL